MKVYGGNICGIRKQESFVTTGPNKGHYVLHICTREPHDDNAHRDKYTGRRWRF